MKLTRLKIGGREFALAFTLDAMMELQDKIDGFDMNELSNYVKTPSGMLDLLVAFARQGEYLEGRVLDADKHWFGAHISPAPSRIAKIQIALLDALSVGMKMEMEDSEDREVDVVLEGIKKKDATGN